MFETVLYMAVIKLRNKKDAIRMRHKRKQGNHIVAIYKALLVILENA